MQISGFELGSLQRSPELGPERRFWSNPQLGHYLQAVSVGSVLYQQQEEEVVLKMMLMAVLKIEVW